MPARDLSEQLKIKNPCTANWDQMIGNEWVRFCEHCQLTVNDLTPLTPKRVRRLLANSKGRICVRYYRDKQGNPILAQVPKRLHHISRGVSRIAAGVFTATLSLANASAEAPSPGQQNVYFRFESGSAVAPSFFGGSIRGKATDSSGEAVGNAGITLLTAEEVVLSATITNSSGEYCFEGLLPGRYILKAEAYGYNGRGMSYVTLAENESVTLNHRFERVNGTEEGERIALGGAVVVVREPTEPLIAAALADDLQALEALLTRENVNVRDKNLQTTALEHAVRNGNREMVQILLSAGADVNSLDSSKQTVLMMVSEESTVDIVWDLINAGAKVNLSDEDGDTALMEAAMEKNVPVLTALIHAGAKVDAKNKSGQTALMIAVDNDQLANIRALVRSGADLNAQDKDGWTALDYAYSSDRERIIKQLLSYGAVTGRGKEKEASPQ